MSDEMKSIGESLAGRLRLPARGTGKPIDYNAVTAEHWAAQQPKKRAWLLGMGCPTVEVDFVLQSRFENRPPLEKAIEFLGTPSPILALFGGYRAGKTVAAVYAMSERTTVMRTQFGGPQTDYMKSIGMAAEPWLSWRYFDSSQRFVMAAEIASLSKNPWDEGSKALTKQLREVGFLVIDELGREWKSEPAKFEEAISYRWSRNLKTILISNLSLEDFPGVYGSGLAARINEHGTVVECGGSRLKAI